METPAIKTKIDDVNRQGAETSELKTEQIEESVVERIIPGFDLTEIQKTFLHLLFKEIPSNPGFIKGLKTSIDSKVISLKEMLRKPSDFGNNTLSKLDRYLSKNPFLSKKPGIYTPDIKNVGTDQQVDQISKALVPILEQIKLDLLEVMEETSDKFPDFDKYKVDLTKNGSKENPKDRKTKEEGLKNLDTNFIENTEPKKSTNEEVQKNLRSEIDFKNIEKLIPFIKSLLGNEYNFNQDSTNVQTIIKFLQTEITESNIKNVFKQTKEGSADSKYFKDIEMFQKFFKDLQDLKTPKTSRSEFGQFIADSIPAGIKLPEGTNKWIGRSKLGTSIVVLALTFAGGLIAFNSAKGKVDNDKVSQEQEKIKVNIKQRQEAIDNFSVYLTTDKGKDNLQKNVSVEKHKDDANRMYPFSEIIKLQDSDVNGLIK
jgi:hypothetical protein